MGLVGIPREAREGIKQTMTDQALVIGIFDQREAAYNTLQALHKAGFQDDQQCSNKK